MLNFLAARLIQCLLKYLLPAKVVSRDNGFVYSFIFQRKKYETLFQHLSYFLFFKSCEGLLLSFFNRRFLKFNFDLFTGLGLLLIELHVNSKIGADLSTTVTSINLKSFHISCTLSNSICKAMFLSSLHTFSFV